LHTCEEGEENKIINEWPLKNTHVQVWSGCVNEDEDEDDIIMESLFAQFNDNVSLTSKNPYINVYWGHYSFC
jgi:GR25 family glycosyltransferase involved in LPS biosynthesis